ncbi:MAG: DoxX family protein [Gammaproteobacteria bacterium]|nr:DoxX family protein [Gammaproteobacteria bacterium]
MKHITISAKILRPLIVFALNFRDLGVLVVRFWVARIFFLSAMDKISSWDVTLVLFKYDYNVPIISFVTAAYIGTGFELLLPIFLVLGLGGRLMIFLFFIYNIICVISFHFLWTPAGSAGFDDHVDWGLLLLLLFLYGSGRYSLDYLIHKKYGYFLKINQQIKKIIRTKKLELQ